VRFIYQGSEALFGSDVQLYQEHFTDDCRMANHLGASEMKNFSSLQIDKSTVIEDRVVPVGYAVPGVELWLVDDDERPVGQETVGQIVVRSRYIAPCYWRRPELTEHVFRADPTDPQLRLFYTGDMGRLDAGGCLHHVGRRDFQVKIRGYRVELGDVTAALLELPAVHEATVVAQPRDDGVRLVAYVVPKPAVAANVTELRTTLEAKLPSYMVPSVFVLLAALPRNANGKVDNAALPEPGGLRPDLDDPYVAPRTPLETMIAELWAELLGLDRVGITDDFIALGGDSLRAALLLGRLRDLVERDLPMAELYQTRTVAEQAVALVRLELDAVPDGELARLLDQMDGGTGLAATDR
jgi:acyl carrier protein